MNGSTGITRKARAVVTRWDTEFQSITAIVAVVHVSVLDFLFKGMVQGSEVQGFNIFLFLNPSIPQSRTRLLNR
jgi:hypothetical protein